MNTPRSLSSLLKVERYSPEPRWVTWVLLGMALAGAVGVAAILWLT